MNDKSITLFARSTSIITTLFLILVTTIFVFLASLIRMEHKQVVVMKVEVDSLFPFQLTTFFMLFIMFFYWYVGKTIGKATNRKVSWDKRSPQTWDYDFSFFLLSFCFIIVIQCMINYKLFTYLFRFSYTEGYEIIYLIPYNILCLLGIQIVLGMGSIIAFNLAYSWELRNKTSNKIPWRCRDMWFELLGWKAIYRGDEEYNKKISKSIKSQKIQIVILLVLISIPVVMFILELLGIYSL